MWVAVGTIVVLVLLLWFALGTQRNLSRGNALLRWLEGGLPRLGAKTTVRWLGSSAVVLQIVDPVAPFEAVQVNVVLEPRDVGVLWAWARQRGRRDFVILRGTLPAPPRFDLEAGGAGRGWTGADRLRRLDPGAWERRHWEDATGPVEVAHSDTAGNDDLAQVETSWCQLAEATSGVWRLSIRNLAPHVEVHLRPPALTGAGDEGEGREGADADAASVIGAFLDLGSLARRV